MSNEPELQKKIIAFLQKDLDKAFTAEEIAQGIGFLDAFEVEKNALTLSSENLIEAKEVDGKTYFGGLFRGILIADQISWNKDWSGTVKEIGGAVISGALLENLIKIQRAVNTRDAKNLSIPELMIEMLDTAALEWSKIYGL